MPETSKSEWFHWPPEAWDEMQERLERFYDAGRAALGQIAPLPAVDVREGPERFIVEADLPGVSPEDCQVNVIGRTLVIEAQRKTSPAGANERHLRRERRGGKLVRQIPLPDEVRAAEVTARCHNGVLQIDLPKQHAVRPHRVEVRSE